MLEIILVKDFTKLCIIWGICIYCTCLAGIAFLQEVQCAEVFRMNQQTVAAFVEIGNGAEQFRLEGLIEEFRIDHTGIRIGCFFDRIYRIYEIISKSCQSR